MKTVFEQLQEKGRDARIVVMRYRFIGDTLLSVPFLRALRQALPEATIDMLVAPNSGEVLAHCPYVDQLIYWDTSRQHRYENPGAETQRPQSFWQSVQHLRKNRYDTAFVLKRSFSSALLAFLAGIPHRIGFNTEARQWLLTQAIPYEKNRHESFCYIDVLSAAGFPDTEMMRDNHLETWLNEVDFQASSALWQQFDGLCNVVVHLTSSNPAKQWIEKESLELLKWLVSKPGCHIHFLGAQSDFEMYEKLLETLNKVNTVPINSFHNWCGQFSLRESLAFLSRMNLAVGVDSGTLHMARAVDIPTIVLFGPMNEQKWNPPGAIAISEAMACRPCALNITCDQQYDCMRELSAQKVIAQCQTLLPH